MTDSSLKFAECFSWTATAVKLCDVKPLFCCFAVHLWSRAESRKIAESPMKFAESFFLSFKSHIWRVQVNHVSDQHVTFDCRRCLWCIVTSADVRMEIRSKRQATSDNEPTMRLSKLKLELLNRPTIFSVTVADDKLGSLCDCHDICISSRTAQITSRTLSRQGQWTPCNSLFQHCPCRPQSFSQTKTTQSNSPVSRRLFSENFTNDSLLRWKLWFRFWCSVQTHKKKPNHTEPQKCWLWQAGLQTRNHQKPTYRFFCLARRIFSRIDSRLFARLAM